jgi:hypothetical protein
VDSLWVQPVDDLDRLSVAIVSQVGSTALQRSGLSRARELGSAPGTDREFVRQNRWFSVSPRGNGHARGALAFPDECPAGTTGTSG